MTAADLQAFRLEAQASFEALFPATIQLPGVVGDIPCAGGFISEMGESLRLGGMVSDYQIGFRVRKSLVPTMPEVGTRLTWTGQDWRIHRVSSDPTDCAWLIYGTSLAK